MALTAEQQKIIDAVIERAEQACRYALKHQNFSQSDPEYIKGWEVAAKVCEGAIRDAVMYYIETDLAKSSNNPSTSKGLPHAQD